ncbi:hypothetical protein FQN57_003604 [Myotisia sp. PD_48]|nr:hypothetical protein FQN57_003604 [Myotisia sp. PD_48]
MASDEDYASFLDKANQDVNPPKANTNQDTNKDSEGFIQTKAIDKEQSQKTPSALRESSHAYMSDMDAYFDPVALKWDAARQNKWPTTGIQSSYSTHCFLNFVRMCVYADIEGYMVDEFVDLIVPGNTQLGKTSILKPTKFDPQEQHNGVFRDIIGSVSDSSVGDEDIPSKADELLKVYRVEHDATRVEYWVVGLDGEHGRILGLKTQAVES